MESKKPKYIAQSEQERCVACGVCMKVCPKEAISIHRGWYAVVDAGRCVGCGICVKHCPAGVMHRAERHPQIK